MVCACVVGAKSKPRLALVKDIPGEKVTAGAGGKKKVTVIKVEREQGLGNEIRTLFVLYLSSPGKRTGFRIHQPSTSSASSCVCPFYNGAFECQNGA